MKFSINSMIQNRGIYLTTLLTFIVLAYLTIFGKYWITEYQTLSLIQKELISKESIIIIKDLESQNSKAIDISKVQDIEKILGVYDSVIKKSLYRVEFSGLAKNGEFETSFRGFGIDLKRDEDSLNRYIRIEEGEKLTNQSNNSIIISQTMARKLQIDVNESLEIFVLNRDNEMIDDEVINIASLKVNGIFKEPFEDRDLLFLSIRLSDFILKTSNIDSIVVEFYLQSDLQRVKSELNLKLKEVGLKVEDNQNLKNSEIMKNIVNSIYIFILLLVIMLAYRDVKLIIEKKRESMRTLINYNWKKSSIFIINLQEIIIFNLSAFLITLIIISAIFSINIGYPSLFTSFNIPINIQPEMIDITKYISPIFILNFSIQTIWFLFFAKFTRD